MNQRLVKPFAMSWYKKHHINDYQFPTFVIGDLGNAFTAMEHTDPLSSENPHEYVMRIRFERLPPVSKIVLLLLTPLIRRRNCNSS